MNKKRKDIIRGNEVSDLYEWSLGGYKQKVLVEGKTKQLPILITLHGGPGTPVPFSVGCRGLFPVQTGKNLLFPQTAAVRAQSGSSRRRGSNG